MCAPPVVCSSLALTMHHSHSMAVFNSLLIKHICILSAALPTFGLQINFPAESLSQLFLQFYVTLMANLQIVRWITWPSMLLCMDCLTDLRDMCLSHLYSSYLAFSLLSSDIILKWGRQQHSKTGYEHKGCGLSVWFPAGKVWPVEASETHHSLQDTPLATGCTGQLSGVKVSN